MSSPPEASGPGTEAPGGAVLYGVAAPAGATVVVPARPASERERDRALRSASARCQHCQAIPDDLLTALAQALGAAQAEGRRLR